MIKKLKDKMCMYAFENFKYVFDLFLLLIYVGLFFVPLYYVKLHSAKIKSAYFKFDNFEPNFYIYVDILKIYLLS